jgi:multiple sugar transport system substrate-binding protein
MLFANNATFARYGLEPPPRRWTIEQFERIGKELVARANPPGERNTVFFCSDVDIIPIMRSWGLSLFNETMTRCTLDDERFADALRLMYKWTFEDRLVPSLEDRQSFDTQSGYGGSALQLFNMGNYAMVRIGRYGLIQFRKFGSMDMSVSEPPHGEFPNTTTGTRCATVYQKSAHPELALRFLEYLASEDYNMQIVRDADALPPNPKYTETEAFVRPVDFPNEWGIHEAFSDAARDVAIVHPRSPFVIRRTALRHFFNARDAVMANTKTPEQAAADAAAGINAEINKTLAEQPKLQARYDEAIARQQEIDRLRAEGRKVPLELIDNPVHRGYYQFKGWAE